MPDSSPLQTFEEIEALAHGFRPAQILLAGVGLGIFDALGETARGANELGEELSLDRRAARILCDALAGAGLLRKSSGSYANTEAGRRFLCSASPESRVASLHHLGLLYQRWGWLHQVVRTGQPVDDGQLDPALLSGKHSFARAMADIGRTSAVQTADALELSGVRRMLDIGGGPGLYAIEFVRRLPQLRAVVLDDPETLEVAARNLKEAGVTERVELRAGDAWEDDLGSGYDLILLSNFVHIYPAADNRRLVERCARALASGGRLVIKDFLLEADRTSPAGASLFAVQMLVSTQGGDCYTREEIRGWFEAAGLKLEQVTALTAQSSLIIGRLQIAGRPWLKGS